MNLQVLSVVVEIFSFLAVIAAIIFGLMQVNQFKRQRKDLAAIELVRSFQDSEFTTAFRLIHSLPENISAAEFASKGTQYIDAAFALSMKYETMGVLVFRDVIPIAAVEELIGGVAVTLWRRLSPWIHSIRKEQSQEQILEWFQWLVERLEERERDQQAPAHKRFQDWQPKEKNRWIRK